MQCVSANAITHQLLGASAKKHSEGIRLLESTDGDGDLLAQEDEIEQKKYPADLLAIPLRSALLQTG